MKSWQGDGKCYRHTEQTYANHLQFTYSVQLLYTLQRRVSGLCRYNVILRLSSVEE
jgi:hypothetical protein